MDIITTMTTPASSLCAALSQGPEAFRFDLTGSNSALCAPGGFAATELSGIEHIGAQFIGTEHLAIAHNGADATSTDVARIGRSFPAARSLAEAKRSGKRRPQPSRFFPLSHELQVS